MAIVPATHVCSASEDHASHEPNELTSPVEDGAGLTVLPLGGQNECLNDCRLEQKLSFRI